MHSFTKTGVFFALAMLSIQTFFGVIATPLDVKADPDKLKWTGEHADRAQMLIEAETLAIAIVRKMMTVADRAAENDPALDAADKKGLEIAFGAKWREKIMNIQGTVFGIKYRTMTVAPWPTGDEPHEGMLAKANLDADEVYIAPLWFSQDTQLIMRATNLIHEASHFGGTRDMWKKEGKGARPVRRNSVTQKQIDDGDVLMGYWHLDFQSVLCLAPMMTFANADSYAVWAHYLETGKKPPHKGRSNMIRKVDDCIPQ
ncbi:hypothetical protein BJ165DRAFT_1528492 [Panaeolus papilionaceus]|nr:hypothetical protein BJ165DRAFT_1528492 [Panaeolus papilionaceus]